MADKVGAELSAQRFRMLEDIARDLAGAIVFPTCFDTTMQLRKEMQNTDVSLERIASVVRVDPLLAARLMHLANSSYHRRSDAPVRTLPAAIARLGLDLVRTTALAIAMSQLMRSKDIVLFSELTRSLQQHTLTTAAAACVVARTFTRIPPDEALLAGLVHDLGAFYMLYRAAQYDELRSRPDSLKYLIVQWHESIGVSLLSALGIPADIVDATIDHDRPRDLPEGVRTLADVVYVANALAGAHFEWLFQDIDPDAGGIGALREAFADLMPEIEREAAEMRAVFA